MSRLLSYLANGRHRLSTVLEPLREQLHPPVPAGAKPEGLGVGYYDGDGVLLRKRPRVPAERVDLVEALQDLETECALVHRRIPTLGGLSPENTQPFRFRRWIFAHHGEVPSFEALKPQLLEEIPDYLRRAIQGVTDSEVLFMLLLTFIHHEGKIDDPNMDPRTVGDFLRATIWRIQSLLDTVPSDENHPPVLDMMVTNGRMLAATCVGHSLHYALREGGEVARGAEGGEAGLENLDRAETNARAVLLSAAHDPERTEGWIAVPEGSVVVVERSLQVRVSDL